MKKNIFILIAVIGFIILIIASLIVYGTTYKEEITIEQKVSTELDYVSNQLIGILGQFNGLSIGSYKLQSDIEKAENKEEKSSNNATEGKSSKNSNSQNNTNISQQGTNNIQNNEAVKMQNSILAKNGKYTINWESIQTKVENLYQTWTTIAIDLNTLNVDGNLILSFSNNLNSATQNIKNKDKVKSMESLTNIYKLLPQYKKTFETDKSKIILLEILSDVVSAYTNVTLDGWENANKSLINAEQLFANMLNSVDIHYENETMINQAYILINELKNAVNIKDKDIFYIHYQNFISKMQVTK